MSADIYFYITASILGITLVVISILIYLSEKQRKD